ncbi:hypothetical protein ACVWXQ_001097 [Bradyrhizobium sp. S3.14.4]
MAEASVDPAAVGLSGAATAADPSSAAATALAGAFGRS